MCRKMACPKVTHAWDFYGMDRKIKCPATSKFSQSAYAVTYATVATRLVDAVRRMLNFETDSQEHPRIFPVADPKQEEGFKVVDRRLFTEEGELRKDAAEQDRRWDEDSKKAASSSAGRAQAKGTPPG